MLNRSAQKAGLPTNRASLLNYINGSGTNNVSLAKALSKTNRGTDTTKKADYEKLEKSARQAEASADRLTAAGAENASASELQSFVDKYNEMLKSLGKSSDTLNLFYAQTAKDTVKEYKQELADIGITMSKDGTLSFDKARFEKFSAEQAAKAAGDTASGGAEGAVNAAAGSGTENSGTGSGSADSTQETAKDAGSEATGTAKASALDALFAKEGLFSRLSYLASRVSDYADANAESYSDYYNAAGSRANAYPGGKYSFWS